MKKKITTLIAFILGFYLIYKFYYDVLYKLQLQIKWIGPQYYNFNSKELLYVIFILMLFCIIIKHIYFSYFIILNFLSLIYYQRYLTKLDMYWTVSTNGMVHDFELFNVNLNLYLFKGLTEAQAVYNIWLESITRWNATSFLIYHDCRPFLKNPVVYKLFDDFFLDHRIIYSYEDVCGQLSMYQDYHIKIARLKIANQVLQKQVDNPPGIVEQCLGNVGSFFNYCYDNPGKVICYAIVFGVVIYAAKELLTYYEVFTPEPTPAELSSELITRALGGQTPIPVGLTEKQLGLLLDLHQKLAQNVSFVESYRRGLTLINKWVIARVTGPDDLRTDFVKRASSEFFDKIGDANRACDTACLEFLKSLNLCYNFETKLIEPANWILETAIPAATAVPANLVTADTILFDILNPPDMTSPFEQFEVIVLQRLSFFGIDFSFSNLTLYLMLSFFVIIIGFYLIKAKIALIPSYWQSVIEIFYSFIFSMLIDQAGKKAKVFFPAIFSLFFFILVSNLLGLIPMSFAVTSHVVITFCLGFGFFVAWIIVAFRNIGLKIFNIFWPTNVPLWLRPLLMVVEILSFTLRPLSLSIRLFVNILAGHILLHLVSGSVVLVFSKAAIFFIIPMVLLLAVFCLELGIAFLQAYIFSILLCIYLHDSFHVHGQ